VSTNQPTSLVKTTPNVALEKWNATPEQVSLLKNTIAKGTTDDEFALFMTVATQMALNPFLRQIHAVRRWDPEQERMVMQIQTGIDGYRLMAERSGVYGGQEGPWWCGDDGQWVDVWLAKAAPAAARVIVHRTDKPRPFMAVALWAEYAQTKKDGTLNAMWRKRGPGQLAKCAEALAFRRAFPIEIGGGAHVDVEMDYLDAESTEARPAHADFTAPPQQFRDSAGGVVAVGPPIVTRDAVIVGAPTQMSAPSGPPPGVPQEPAKRGPGRPRKEDAARPTSSSSAEPSPAATPSSPTNSSGNSAPPASTSSAAESAITKDMWGQPIAVDPTPPSSTTGPTPSAASGDASTAPATSGAAPAGDDENLWGSDPVDTQPAADPVAVKLAEFHAWLAECKNQRELQAGFRKWYDWTVEMSDRHQDERFRKKGAITLEMQTAYGKRKGEVPA